MNTIKNPQEALQQMAMNNPQYNQVMQYVKDNGGDAKSAFYKMAKEKGIDPEEFLKMLKS